MEDEEDIQSQNSGESGSPATSRSDGRITVTVASVPPSSQGSLTLALPSQQPMQQQQQQQQLLQQSSRSSGKSGGGGGGGGGGSGGREDCWSEGATSVLIDAWGERYLELSRGNLKQNHWKDVADIVGSLDNSSKTPKTDIQCKNRIDTVKKKYKMEKAKIAAGGGPSKWPFYERLDRLIGSTAKLPSSSGGGAGSSGGMTPSQRVPMGIPLGARSNPNLRHQQQQHHLQKHKPPIRKRPVASDSESEPELSPDSADDFPPVTYERNKRPRSHNQNDFGGGGRSGTNTGKDAIMEKRGGKDKNIGNSVKDLAWAIMKFGEAYEQAESSKLQQLVDMEKQRMKFAKELEVQRMQFFMKTQLELSQLHNNHHRRSGNGRSNHHRSSINTAATNNNDHSDCSN